MAPHTFSLSLFSTLVAITSALPTITSREADCFPPKNSTASSISWSPCQDLETLQCANFSVPIDWDTPYGEHFNLGLVKLPAKPSNTTSKIGSLFINPGGPGGSAAGLVAQIAQNAFPADILYESFDIIGLDPRGVGLSHQVECNMSIMAERVSLFPQTEQEYEKLVDRNKRFGASCREQTGPLFEYLDTISTVKDHEAVRVALGNKPFNYMGLSYGTQLGAQYASLFPDNIRVFALDGILQHSQSEISNLLIETTSYSLTLTHFFEWAAKNESSVLKGQDVEKLWESLLSNATTTPIPAPSCKGTDCRTDVTAEEILFNAQVFLQVAGVDRGSGRSWQTLSSALYNASHGDASALSTTYSLEAASAVSIACLDWTYDLSGTLSGVLAKQTMAREYAPLTRGASQMWTLQQSCQGWPVAVRNPPKKLDVNTKTTILMVQSTSDPSTGLPWALGMLDEVRNKSFVLREGDGHTSLALGGETTEVIIEYLVSGKAPKDGLVLTS